MTDEEIAAAAAAEADEARLAASFRTTTETELEECHNRLLKLEAGAGAGAGVPAGVDENGNSLAGQLRTFDARITQIETVQADNTSNILRMSELVQTQIGGLNQRIAELEVQLRALQPTT